MKTGLQVLIGVLVVLVIVLGVTLAVWPGQADSKDITGHAVKVVKKEPIKLGVSLPLTGEAASYGQGIIGAIKLAVKEINTKGGVDGRKIKLVVEDDQCNSKSGVAAMSKLVNVNDVDAVIGPLCSAAGGASLPIAQESRTPTIFWASAPHLTSIGDYVFRTYPSDAFQGRFAAGFIYNELGKRSAAAIYVHNDWGQGINDVFVERFKELGGDVVFDEGVAQDAKDFRSTVAKMKAAGPDVVYLPLYPAGGVNAVKQIKELGVDAALVGGDAFDGDEFVGSGVAEDVIYTVGKINNPDEFKAKVTAITGKGTNSFTSLGYDAVYIFADAMRRAGSTDNAAVRDALAATHYTRAISLPLIEFDSKGDLNSAEFEVKTIKNRKSVSYAG